MIATLLATLVVASMEVGSTQAPPSAPQEIRDAPAQQDQPQSDPAQLEEVTVEGRRMRDATADFVRKVSAPAPDRGAATWHETLCVGVSNLRRAAAEIVISRISDTAESLGLRLGRPGCNPSVFIVFSAHADRTAREIIASRGRLLHSGNSGTDLGDAALAAFETSDQPVRWWHVSQTVNADTGQPSRRQRGQGPFVPGAELNRPSQFGPNAQVSVGSRLHSLERDDLTQVIIIVDIERTGNVGFNELSDYLAMVSLAQIEPDFESESYDSVLNLFAPDWVAADGLTAWDRAYLDALYRAEQTHENSDARLGAVANLMARTLLQQQNEGVE